MPDPLEQELRTMMPRSPSPELESRIAADYQKTIARRPLADRLLLSTLSTALAASLLIAIILLTDNSAPSPPPLAHSPQAFTLADTPRLLAQLIASDPTPSHPAPSTFPN